MIRTAKLLAMRIHRHRVHINDHFITAPTTVANQHMLNCQLLNRRLQVRRIVRFAEQTQQTGHGRLRCQRTTRFDRTPFDAGGRAKCCIGAQLRCP